MLLEERKIKPLDIFTPQKWQTVILRNYGLVSVEKLAEVLLTTVDVIQTEAKRLGIEAIAYTDRWKKYGYITIVRNNWHLLPYGQLMQLLDMTEAELEYNLKEDDFLDVKLGNFKPYTKEVKYIPLTEEEALKTQALAKTVKEKFLENYTLPFEFSYDKITEKSQEKATVSDDFLKIVYGYSMMYGDTLLTGEEPISDELLQKLANVGVNGIWFQGVLSKLSYYPFVEGVSQGYEIRRENLRKLIKKCAKYGVKIYLYFNEPRALNEKDFTEKTENLKGKKMGEQYALCTSKKEVQEYLYNAVKDFAKSVPGLGGIITITASENLTNCYSWDGDAPCPICSKRPRPEVVAEVNNIIMNALRDSNTGARLLVNLWGWAPYRGWTEEEVLQGIELLDKDAEVMSVSEFGTIIKDGVAYNVGEYSLSRVGPCEETKAHLAHARKFGHKILAKVQINNSWEFAITPYIPVYELIIEHISNLKELGVTGLMLSWTLGGYPSPSFSLVDKLLQGKLDYDEWLQEHYGENWKLVKESVHLFSEGFRHYPFNGETLYFAAQEVGASNLWYKEKTGLAPTMVGYPYDAIDGWKSCSDEEFTSEIELLLDGFEKGLSLLDGVVGNESLEELKNMAETVYVNMKSMLVQFRYNQVKEKATFEDVKGYIEEEEKLTERLYALAAKDARIGYEASNHYYFTQNTFLEKFLNLEALKKQFDK